jgi:hypothetical protein
MASANAIPLSTQLCTGFAHVMASTAMTACANLAQQDHTTATKATAASATTHRPTLIPSVSSASAMTAPTHATPTRATKP